MNLPTITAFVAVESTAKKFFSHATSTKVDVVAHYRANTPSSGKAKIVMPKS